MCKNRCGCWAMSSSIEDLRSPRFWRASLGEGVGTMILVVVGCGSCLGGSDWETNDPSILQIAMAFGLAVATVVWCLAHVSGGHVNPAVTVAFLITRKISVVRGILYVFAQCTGALAGAGILYALTPQTIRGSIGMTTVNKALHAEQGFGVELVITFVLVFTVFASVDGHRSDLHGSAPLTIGLSVTLCHLFAIKYTGSSMNPARTFGPAVVTGIWTDHWIYWGGPLVGGIVAGMLYEMLFAANASRTKARNYLLASRYEPNDTHDDPPVQQPQHPVSIVLSDTTESNLGQRTSLLKLHEEPHDEHV